MSLKKRSGAGRCNVLEDGFSQPTVAGNSEATDAQTSQSIAASFGRGGGSGEPDEAPTHNDAGFHRRSASSFVLGCRDGGICSGQATAKWVADAGYTRPTLK
jgi:hypothetical protein